MDAKPPKTTGSTAKLYDRATSTIVGARAGDHGPARTLAARPRGDDARGEQHRPGCKAE